MSSMTSSFYTVELPAESVRKVESVLNITDEVIRFLITRPDFGIQETTWMRGDVHVHAGYLLQR